jgi:hypothetical protein
MNENEVEFCGMCPIYIIYLCYAYATENSKNGVGFVRDQTHIRAVWQRLLLFTSQIAIRIICHRQPIKS